MTHLQEKSTHSDQHPHTFFCCSAQEQDSSIVSPFSSAAVHQNYIPKSFAFSHVFRDPNPAAEVMATDPAAGRSKGYMTHNRYHASCGTSANSSYITLKSE